MARQGCRVPLTCWQVLEPLVMQEWFTRLYREQHGKPGICTALTDAFPENKSVEVLTPWSSWW